MHGQGTFIYADGRKEAGVFENGKLKPGICSKEGDRKDLTLCVTEYWEEDTWCVMNLNLKNRSKEILQAIGFQIKYILKDDEILNTGIAGFDGVRKNK